MTMTDPIGDMLARIRNANTAFHETVEIPASKEKVAIAKILKDEGYIEDFSVAPATRGEVIRVNLKYGPERTRTIFGLTRVSKPGLRVYAKAGALPKVLGGMGTVIISTSAGVMTDKQARRKKVGGEVIAFVW